MYGYGAASTQPEEDQRRTLIEGLLGSSESSDKIKASPVEHTYEPIAHVDVHLPHVELRIPAEHPEGFGEEFCSLSGPFLG